jgi:hypothetical protein
MDLNTGTITVSPNCTLQISHRNRVFKYVLNPHRPTSCTLLYIWFKFAPFACFRHSYLSHCHPAELKLLDWTQTLPWLFWESCYISSTWPTHGKHSSIVMSGISHRGQVTWLPASAVGVWCHCACVEMCLPNRNLETGCITLLFHCQCMYYLETADSAAQPFLHGANTPQYVRSLWYLI